MSDEDISFAKKKKKIVLDDEGEGDQINVITTKTGTENAARENYDHSKANGDKTSGSNKSSPKKPDASQKKPEAKPADKSGQSSKPKPDDSKNAQKSGDKKPVENKDKKELAKPAEKKSSEANGQQQKKSGDEEKKTNDKQSPAKPAAKPAPKKRPVESDSESEESDESSDDERRKKKKKQASPTKKPAKKPEKKESAKAGPGGVTKVTKSKDTLVYEVLKRWWYAVPEWPPADFDYAGELNKLKLRKVDQKYWRQEPEEKEGLRKVVEIPSFVGVYKDSKGELIDIRPKETCPSYKNFKNKSITELCELHALALKKQVEELESSEVVEERLLTQLKGELKRAERTFEAQKAKATK